MKEESIATAATTRVHVATGLDARGIVLSRRPAQRSRKSAVPGDRSWHAFPWSGRAAGSAGGLIWSAEDPQAAARYDHPTLPRIFGRA
ncbi:hypothetical protein [Actinomadura sp. GTD37]|uniref:hypothetical protein n=1 Tax=Actinomadura sp. GTD37 TaxID=1778030 RepID=UPI0035C0213E